MPKVPPYSLCLTAICSNDEPAVRRICTKFPTLLQETGTKLLLRTATQDNVPMVALLVELGVDVNAPVMPPDPETVIVDAADEGAVNAVRWLLEHGAKPNHERNGETRCMALACAGRNGHLEVVKLLVEHGADINAIAADKKLPFLGVDVPPGRDRCLPAFKGRSRAVGASRYQAACCGGRSSGAHRQDARQAGATFASGDRAR